MAFNLFPQTDFRQMDLNYVLQVSKQAAANLEEYAADKEQVVATQAAAEEALAAAQQDIQTATQAAASAGQDAQTATQAAGTATQAAADAEQGAQTASAAAATATAVQESIPADYTTLSNDVDNLKSDLNDISTPVRVSENFLPPDEEVGIYDATTGVKSPASYMVRTPNAIKVPDGVGTIYVRAKTTFTNYLGVFEYSTEDTDSFIRVTSYINTDRATIVLNSNTRYIRLNISNNYSISDFSINTTDVAYNDYETQRYIKKSALPAIDDSDLPENVIKSQIITSANYFNNADIVANEWIQANGSISSDAGYYHSNAIPLPAGDYVTIAFKGSYYGNAVNVHLYNTSGDWIGKVIGTLLTDDGNNSLMTFTLPTDSLVKINLTETGKDTDMIVAGNSVNDYPATFVPYEHYYAVESGIHLNEDMKADVNTLLGAGILYDKKLSVNGDSICYGAGYLGGYAKIIGENNNMVVQNIAVGGGTIATGTTASGANRYWISDHISDMDTDADYIILEGGVNDASLSVPLGSLSGGYSVDSFDTTTFYGALESCFAQMLQRFPGKKLGFILVHKCSTNMLPGTSYYEAVFKCAEKWGIPVLNLNISLPGFAMYASDNPLYALTQAYTLNGDGWHPNEDGYKKYYVPKIEAWLKTL